MLMICWSFGEGNSNDHIDLRYRLYKYTVTSPVANCKQACDYVEIQNIHIISQKGFEYTVFTYTILAKLLLKY